MKMRTLVLVTFALVVAFTAAAQEKDPIGESFFPPELIMANQGTIGLTDNQKNTMREFMKESQAGFMDLNWEMQELKSGLLNIISPSSIDETKALAQLEQVLNQENKIKKKQFTLMIRLKNILTEKQQIKLNELRN